jgi:LPXTG-motif cell wall-anchored protein
MKTIRWINMTLVAAALVAANGAIQPVSAQAPVPGGPTTTTTTDTGAISNAPTDSTTSTTTTTTTTEAAPATVEVAPATTTTELANTGGEPILMSLLGLTIAGGAYFVRRRVAA